MLLRLLFVILPILLSPLVGAASWGDVRPCLTTHIREAIELNKQRAPFYELLSQGRSREISQRLIEMERRLMLLAPVADAAAAPFQFAGVMVLCEDLIEMSEAPSMRGYHSDGVDAERRFVQPPVAELKNTLRDLLRDKDYTQLALFADAQIHHLESMPRYNCMVKHMLESIRRVAALTLKHKARARQKIGLSTEFLSRKVLRSHIDLLEESAQIDFLAAPLQAEGLPIVCQDVPAIPWP